MANLYLSEATPAADFVPGARITIAGAEGRHAVTVSRLRAGESILLGNGAGVLGEAVVESVENKSFVGLLTSVRRQAPGTPRITLVQALAKGDRDERAVETATEYGVDAVLPWQAERSVSRWLPGKAAKGVERWSSIVREAAKQSLRPRVPEVVAPVDTAGLAAWITGERTVLILHPSADRALSSYSAEELQDAEEIALVVGPEGGFSPAELERFRAAGASVVRLGETVLRTSSAGPAALTVLNVRLNRW